MKKNKILAGISALVMGATMMAGTAMSASATTFTDHDSNTMNGTFYAYWDSDYADNTSDIKPGTYVFPLYRCQSGEGLGNLANNGTQHFNGQAKLVVKDDYTQELTIAVENWSYYEAFVPMDQNYNSFFGTGEDALYPNLEDVFPKKLVDSLIDDGNENAEEYSTSDCVQSSVDNFFMYGEEKYGDIIVDADTNASMNCAYVTFEIRDYREEIYVATWTNKQINGAYCSGIELVLDTTDFYSANDIINRVENGTIDYRLRLASSWNKYTTTNSITYNNTSAGNVSYNIFDSITITKDEENKKVNAKYHINSSYASNVGTFQTLSSINDYEYDDANAWILYKNAEKSSLPVDEDGCIELTYDYSNLDNLIFGDYIYFTYSKTTLTKKNIYYCQPVLAPPITTKTIVDEETGVRITLNSNQVEDIDNIELAIQKNAEDEFSNHYVTGAFVKDESEWYRVNLIDKTTQEKVTITGSVRLEFPLSETITDATKSSYAFGAYTSSGQLKDKTAPVVDTTNHYWVRENETELNGSFYHVLKCRANETEKIYNLSDGVYEAEAYLYKRTAETPTVSMANDALVHDVRIVVKNGVKTVYFKAQEMAGYGYLGALVCNDSEPNSVYADSIIYTKYAMSDELTLLDNCGYDPATEWGCVEGGILTLIEGSYSTDSDDEPFYNVAVSAPPMARMGNSSFSDIRVDQLTAKLVFVNVNPSSDTEEKVKSDYPYDKSALLHKVRNTESLYNSQKYSATTFAALRSVLDDALTMVENGTASSDDYMNKIANIDEAIANLKEPEVTVSGYQASVADDVTLNYVLNIPEALEDKADNGKLMATITYADGTTKEIAVQAEDEYFVPVSVAPKEIANEISVTIGDGTFTYSVKEYLESVLNSETATDSEKAVAKSLLNYAGFAQDYFKAKNADANAYLSDTKANENVDSTLADITDDAVKAFDAPTLGDNVSFYGASLTCDHDTSIKIYFKVTDDIANHTFTANGETVEAVEAADGIYCITYSGISAKNLAAAYTFSVDGTNFTYGAYNYIYAALNATEVQSGALTELKNMVKAIYYYAEAAKLA